MKIFYFLILVLINCVTGFPQEPIKLWFGNGYDGVKGANGAQEPNKRWFGNGYDGVKGANGAAGSSTTTVMSNLETFYTTFTYFKTITVDGTASVQTSTDIYSNINTEAIPIGVVTPYTTFTYWTTMVDGSETITTSIEETLTNILAGSAAYTSVIEAALPGLSGEEINATPPTNSFIEQTAFTFPTTSITEDLDGSEEISTVVPVLQSSEGEEDKSVFDTLATSSQFSLTSSQGFGDDDDFVQLRGSSIPISTSAFGAASESINPSSVLQRGSKTFSSELVESTTSPTFFIRPIELNINKPNPFKARLKELQQDRLRQLQEANKINNDEEQ